MSFLLKILLFIFIISYVIRRLSPFIFGWLISSIFKNASTQNDMNKQEKKENKTKKSDKLGEYIEYEDIE